MWLSEAGDPTPNNGDEDEDEGDSDGDEDEDKDEDDVPHRRRPQHNWTMFLIE